MQLKLRHLAVFHAVMEEGSVSKAAERMGLTQPAVSLALSTLEDILGYSLFNRSKGYFVPKPEAEQLHEDAELAILAFEKFAAHAQLIGAGDTGLVRIGSIGAPAVHFLPDVISQFTSLRDRIEVQLLVRSSAQIAYLVGNGQTDIGLVEAPVAAQSVSATRVSIPCVCILRNDDPLAAEPVLTPVHLADRRLISVSQDHQLDRQIKAAFVDAGVAWYSQIRCYFFAIIRNLVARGTGVAIVDAVNGCAGVEDGVTWRPFEPTLRFELDVITRADAALQKPAIEFLDMTIERLRGFESRS
ncbi:MAG: LysR family transcriptional regulator [Rhodobacter sp.]|nr:LysR family transcriptional regulator [Rhodobacter sp.]